MSDNTISIIVPVYNAEHTLKKCVQSLINQTYQNIEIILVNDGSTDASLRICREFAESDNRITVIDMPNGGVSSARNAGLDAAKGDFVMFCDSDDIVHPQWCEKLLAKFTEDTLVMCRYKAFQSGEEVTDWAEQIEKADTITSIPKKDFIVHQSDGGWSPVIKIYENRVIREHDIRFPTELSLGEDLTFILRYLSVIGGDIKVLETPLYYYRVDAADSLSKKAPSVEQCELFNQILTTYLREFGQAERAAWDKKDQIMMYDFEKILLKTARSKDKGFAKKYREIRSIMRTEAYRECCRTGCISTNRIYSFLLRNRLALSVTVLLRK